MMALCVRNMNHLQNREKKKEPWQIVDDVPGTELMEIARGVYT